MLFTYLSSGVAVPRVVGLSEAKAKAAVRASGLRAVTHRAYIDGVDTGVVARQRPAKGELDKQATVDLWVSRGPLHVAAPALRGLTTRRPAGRWPTRVCWATRARFGRPPSRRGTSHTRSPKPEAR